MINTELLIIAIKIQANPVMPDLNGLVDCSLFINDLSLHDCSRDLG